MLRSPLRRALAALSLALPACGDDTTDSGSATQTGTGGDSTGSTGGTTETPTTGVESTTGGPTDPTSSSQGTGTEGTISGTSTVGTSGTDATTGTTGDGLNESPVALMDRYITKAKQPLVVNAAGGLLKNDYDDDGDKLSLVAADPLSPGLAMVTALQDGSFTYQPPPSLWGVDSFEYKIWDGVDGFAQTQVRVDVNPTAIDLEYVAEGRGGFAIDGEAPGHYSGRVVHSVGDLDGDGLDEVVVAARNADMNTGRVYVVFGKYDNLPVSLNTLEEQQRGFVIYGEIAGDFAGTAVAGLGDVDGDGLGDLAIGAPKASPNGKSSGAIYVVRGKTGSEPVYLAQVNNGDGGFAIYGEKISDFAGRSVAGAGDVNGDGLQDIVVGAYGADPGGSFSGAAYVVFGREVGKPTELAAIAAGMGGGFAINGEVSLDFAGSAVGGAGDVDGDGLSDIIVGSYGHDTAGDGAGRAYVVFGKADTAAVLLTDVAAGQGGAAFDGVAAYDRAAIAVAGAGDVNGDGFADVVIGAPLADVGSEDSGSAYVVFGGPGMKSGSLSEVAAGTTGLTLIGVQGRDYAGTSVERAGDVDADGLDDVLIGAPGSNPHGGDSGRGYVVFGDPAPQSGSLIAISSGDGGFSLDGEATEDYNGFSLAPAGDVNGDGHADVICGARGNDGKGLDAGRSYVVFGGDYSNLQQQTFGPGPDNLAGGDGGDYLVGGRGDDLITLKGADVVYAGAGADELRCEQTDFIRVDGGAGEDLLRLVGAGLALDLTTRSDLDLVDVEEIALTDGGQTLKLQWRDVRALARRSHVLTISGVAGTVVADLAGAGFVDAGVNGGFRVFEHPVFTVRIAEALDANVGL
jgi:hypothetical protein